MRRGAWLCGGVEGGGERTPMSADCIEMGDDNFAAGEVAAVPLWPVLYLCGRGLLGRLLPLTMVIDAG